jgi:hypothetical protein
VGWAVPPSWDQTPPPPFESFPTKLYILSMKRRIMIYLITTTTKLTNSHPIVSIYIKNWSMQVDIDSGVLKLRVLVLIVNPVAQATDVNSIGTG